MNLVNQKSDEEIQYFEKPLTYEHKSETSFKIFQVFEDCALASEVTNKEFNFYNGNTVLIEGDDFYDGQVVTVKEPLRIGSWTYFGSIGRDITVPVIGGKLSAH